VRIIGKSLQQAPQSLPALADSNNPLGAAAFVA
jgi:hypothetical protein